MLLLAPCASCAPDTIPLGRNATFLWWSDFEEPAFADWTSLPGGVGYTQMSGAGRLAEARAPLPVRSGGRAMHASLGAQQTPYAHALVTRGDLPVEAWYTAWFYVPRSPDARPFLTIFKLSHPAAGEDRGVVTVVATQPDGTAAPYVAYLDSRKTLTPTPPVTLPIARWFAVEAFVRLAVDGTGRFEVYLDGQALGRADGDVIEAAEGVTWTLGPITVETPGLDVFVDDAAITTRRLGADFPPFSR